MSDNGQAQDTVTLTIDGKEITVPKGTLVIRAAEELGIIIPRFCDHPLLDPAGACRQCLVDIEGQRKPAASCTTECGDGWEVRTHLTSDVAKKAQEGVLEFLLINHPLDCPMCDKGGECPLQDQALSHGTGESRFVDEKRRYNKPVAVSEQVLLDRERCVLCARCTRFSNEIAGDPFIELFERGALEQVAIYEDEPYRSYFSGNVIQICPVGALTSASYRFKARPFDLRSAPSVCNHCSAGCNLTVQARRGEVQRQLARTNMAVNETWNCDKGRFAFRNLTNDARLREPMVRRANELTSVSWSDALQAATAAITAATDKGAGRVAVLAGGRLADEDAYALAKYTRAVLGSDDLDFRTRLGADDEPATLAAVAARPSATYADVENAKVVLVVGLDTEEENPILHLRLRKAWRKNRTKIVPVGPREGSLERYAWRRLPTLPGHEGVALAAIGRAMGHANLAELAAAGNYAHRDLEQVLSDLRDATGDAVLLVGERAGSHAGVLAAAVRLADDTGIKLGWVPRRAGARGALEAGLLAGALPGGRRLDDAEDRAAVEAVWGELPSMSGRDARAILEAAANGQIDVLHLVGVDLISDCSDAALAKKALDKVGTVIVQDLASNATTAHADVVLPVTATQERGGAFTNWEGRHQHFRPAVEAPRLAQDDHEILVQLAAYQGKDLGFGDLDQIRAEMASLPGRETPHAVPEPTAPSTTEDEGLALLTYPLLLDRGTLTAGSADLLKTARAPYVATSPATAEAIGAADGDEVTVTGGDVELRLPLRVERGMVDGVVYVPTNSTDTSGVALGDRVTVGRAAAEVGA